MTLSVNAIWEPFCVYQTDVKKKHILLVLLMWNRKLTDEKMTDM